VQRDLSGADLVPFHGDEATQIYMSRDYAYQFLERDLGKIYFNLDPANPAEQAPALIRAGMVPYSQGSNPEIA
jgi:hypothetical protein